MSSVSVLKLGSIATLLIDTGVFMKNNYNPGEVLFTIPLGYRPRTNIHFGCIASYMNTPSSYPLTIGVDGRVSVYGPITKATDTIAYYGAITYPI